ncbi:allantoinase AllB [Rummeliibacillus suwonensis]|uniref:allantoinase AllB n=1 Tax=Rummeliibacillus suwonensis TaxID=1306154 RepID=UPI00289B1E27|nr:allantoinase AllB [Rummeliibacillus suwonensis]
MYEVIIKNGKIVTASGIIRGDIAIQDGKIQAIATRVKEGAVQEIDATNQFVFPGLIDIHVHFSEPGREIWEGFKSGSQMLAAGGCTTFFDMPLNSIPATTNAERVREKQKLAKQKSITHCELWGGLVDDNVEKLEEMANAGVIGYKAFMPRTNDPTFEHVQNEILLKGMKKIAKLGKILALHAESDEILQFALQEAKKDTSATIAGKYLNSRPKEAELEAVSRAIYYSRLTHCPLHFVHISTSEAVHIIQQARDEGLDVSLETCPHYLLFNSSAVDQIGYDAKCAPPLREEKTRLALLEAFKRGEIDMLSSDHSPCTKDLKDPDQYDIFSAWGGINGGQFTFLAALEIAKKENIPYSDLIYYTSIHAARRFHLKDKGSIEVGKLADIVIVSEKDFIVQQDKMLSKNPQSIYERHTFLHTIECCLVQGRIVYNAKQ